MTSKFEQLIEYVINDEEAKARELFHDIVVEKSREIYENLMNEEDSEEELDENDSLGGDASDSLIDDVEAEEEGMHEGEEGEEFDSEETEEFDDEDGEEGEDLELDMDQDSGEGGDIEDRVVDLEDKLDELMAEFEAIMGGEDHGMGDEDHGIDSDLEGEDGDELAGDALAQDDTMAFSDDDAMMENITLDKVPAPRHGDNGANHKSPVAFNSGARGMQGSPVRMTGDVAQGRSAPKTSDLPEAGKFKNTPGKGTSNSKLETTPKPTLSQATGTNTRTPFPKG